MNKSDIFNNSRINTMMPHTPTHPVAVILPVYRGVDMTKRCIVAAMPGILGVEHAQLLVINDASPDAGMQAMLEQLTELWPGRYQVLQNDSNLGFVKTVNRGLVCFPDHDVVLLNSDVVVPTDWLGRLIDEAYSLGNIGTVTPFSNNATICSFPDFLQENPQPFDLDVNTVDAAFRQSRLPCIEAPTGVGFCMYIRRACLNQIGLLNEQKFGRGYGEENDLCQRALKKGWLNLLSPNMYAYHEGSVSFSSDKQALVDRAMQVLDELHPNYHADVHNFVMRDPLKAARVARYIQLLSSIAVPKVLHVSHALGGGVGQHITELAEYSGRRIAHILLAPYDDNGTVSISLSTTQNADKLFFKLPLDYAAMLETLTAMGISAVHFHHTIGLDPKILDLPVDLGVTQLITVHDFYWLNGNPTLTDESGRYPGYYSEELYNPLYPLPTGVTPEQFREPLRQFFKRADGIIFPSDATRSIFSQVLPLDHAIVASHPEKARDVMRKPMAFTAKGSYTIGVLGALSREKGADLLEDLSVIATGKALPFKFKLLGYSYRPLKKVDATGPFAPAELSDLIRQHQLDVIFFPALWPETYSYTLSYALASGLPIIAPNIGAFVERLNDRANTLLFDHLAPADRLIGLLTAFIEQLGNGETIAAPHYTGNEPRHDFYQQTYLDYVARDLKTPDPLHQSALFMPNPVNLLAPANTADASGWREIVLAALWRIYMHPSMRWLGRVIPFRILRSVKRRLSRRPIHDIVKTPTGE